MSSLLSKSGGYLTAPTVYANSNYYYENETELTFTLNSEYTAKGYKVEYYRIIGQHNDRSQGTLVTTGEKDKIVFSTTLEEKALPQCSHYVSYFAKIYSDAKFIGETELSNQLIIEKKRPIILINGTTEDFTTDDEESKIKVYNTLTYEIFNCYSKIQVEIAYRGFKITKYYSPDEGNKINFTLNLQELLKQYYANTDSKYVIKIFSLDVNNQLFFGNYKSGFINNKTYHDLQDEEGNYIYRSARSRTAAKLGGSLNLEIIPLKEDETEIEGTEFFSKVMIRIPKDDSNINSYDVDYFVPMNDGLEFIYIAKSIKLIPDSNYYCFIATYPSSFSKISNGQFRLRINNGYYNRSGTTFKKYTQIPVFTLKNVDISQLSGNVFDFATNTGNLTLTCASSGQNLEYWGLSESSFILSINGKTVATTATYEGEKISIKVPYQLVFNDNYLKDIGITPYKGIKKVAVELIYQNNFGYRPPASIYTATFDFNKKPTIDSVTLELLELNDNLPVSYNYQSDMTLLFYYQIKVYTNTKYTIQLIKVSGSLETVVDSQNKTIEDSILGSTIGDRTYGNYFSYTLPSLEDEPSSDLGWKIKIISENYSISTNTKFKQNIVKLIPDNFKLNSISFDQNNKIFTINYDIILKENTKITQKIFYITPNTNEIKYYIISSLPTGEKQTINLNLSTMEEDFFTSDFWKGHIQLTIEYTQNIQGQTYSSTSF